MFSWIYSANGFRLLVLLGLLSCWQAFGQQAMGLQASGETNPDPSALDAKAIEESAPARPAATGEGGKPLKQRTLIDTIIAGGYIGVIIILLSVVAVGFIIEHFMTIRKERLIPDAIMDDLEHLIQAGDLEAAVKLCQAPSNYCLGTDVVLAGLERYQGSKFGFADYKAAVEEAGEDNTARLYRKTDTLSVIGAIAPMLGLFGTVEGMMESFNTIASRGGMARPEELADSIGKALVTTWLGLIVAIPSMVAFSYFRNRIDSLVSDCGRRIERVLMPLGRERR